MGGAAGSGQGGDAVRRPVGQMIPLPVWVSLARLCVLLLPFAMTRAVADPPSPRETLEMLHGALETHRVVGDMVRFEGTVLAGFAVGTGVDGRTFIRPLDSPADGDLAADVVVSREYLLPRFPAAGLLRSARWYGLEACRARSIAGRMGRCVRVVPRDEHRPGYSLWVDVSSGVLLGVTVHGPDGMPLEFMQYTRIRAEQRLPAPETGPDRRAGSADGGFLPRWLPPGFVAVAAARSGEGRVTRFSDGVTGFSVFVDPLEDPSAVTGESARGAAVVVDRVVRAADGQDHLITIAGEIPLPTARRIVHGVRPES